MNRKRKRSSSQDSDAGSADDSSCRSRPAARSISDRVGKVFEESIDDRLRPIEDSVQALDDHHVKLRADYEAQEELLKEQHALLNCNAQGLQSTTNRLANRITVVEGNVESQKAIVQELQEDSKEKSSLFDEVRNEMQSNAAEQKTGASEMKETMEKHKSSMTADFDRLETTLTGSTTKIQDDLKALPTKDEVEKAMTEKMAQSKGELQILINTTKQQNVQNVATLRSDLISTINGVDDKTAKRIQKLEARIPPLDESTRSTETLISDTNQRVNNLSRDLEQIVLIQQKVTSLEQAQKEDSENFQTGLVALQQSQTDLKTLTTKNQEQVDTNLNGLRTLAEATCVKVTEQHERLKRVETTQKGLSETVEQTQEEVKAVRTQSGNLKDRVTSHQTLLDTTLPQQATAISDLLARVQTLENYKVRLDLYSSRLKELDDKSASQEKELVKQRSINKCSGWKPSANKKCWRCKPTSNKDCSS
jgi:chromosome segregation ATPase